MLLTLKLLVPGNFCTFKILLMSDILQNMVPEKKTKVLLEIYLCSVTLGYEVVITAEQLFLLERK